MKFQVKWRELVLSKQTSSILAIIIILLGLSLRLYQLGEIPSPGETADEYAWIFMGSSLIQNQVPVGWSYFPYPQVDNTIIAGHYFPIVSPFMDHPPLFSLLPGTIQTLSGNTWQNPISLGMLRLPMVLLSGLTMWLLYAWSRSWMNRTASLTTLVLYAVAPSAILGNRMILAENLLTPLMLGQLILLETKFNQKIRGLESEFINFLYPLIKIAGLAMVLAHTLVLMMEKRWREMIGVIAGALIGISLLIAYASIFDLEQFLNIQLLQGSYRHTTFLTILLGFFGKPKAIDTIFFDGLLIAAKLSFIVLAFNLPKKIAVKRMYVFASVYLIFLAATVGEWVQAPNTSGGHGSYGWYWYPLFPLFFASLGYLWTESITQRKRVFLFIINLFLILQFRLIYLYTGLATLGNGGLPDWLVLGILGVIGAVSFLPNRWWIRSQWIILSLVILASIAAILLFDPIAYSQEASYFTVI
jgi:hypothetical protein